MTSPTGLPASTQTTTTSNGPDMKSINRITIATRVSQCVAATALIAGVTIGAAATAGAE
jgi:hypothetical protein